jgi:hypothetical protein
VSEPISREEFVSYISLLQKSVDEGFAGVHRRQDATNGRIGKAEDRILALEGLGVKMGQIKGKLAGAAGTGATVLALIKWLYDAYQIAPKP